MYKNDSLNRSDVNILLVEDCPDSRAIFKQVLKKIGAKITCAENGKECVDLALESLNAKQGFDVILMDLQMPVMDGHSATRQLRERGYRLPIVAMTARSAPNDQQESERSGFDGHISKLTGMKGLISEIKKQIFRSKTLEIEMPVLPLVPQFLRENPVYAELALSSLGTLEDKVKALKIAIESKDFQGIVDLTYQFGNLSLYGYSQFSMFVSQVQLAAENEDSNQLETKIESLEKSVKAIIAGIPQLKKLVNLS